MQCRFFVTLFRGPGATDHMEVIAAPDLTAAWERARKSAAYQPDVRAVAVFSQEDITRMGMLLAAARAMSGESISIEL